MVVIMGVGHELRKVAKFSVIGTIAFIVDITLFNILRLDAVGMGPIWAKVFSVATATSVSWVGSRFWTFRDGRNQRVVREAVLFFAINAGGLLIAMACLWVSNNLLGFRSVVADNVSGNVIGVALGNVFRYGMYRYVLYRPRRDVIALDSPSASATSALGDEPAEGTARAEEPIPTPPRSRSE